MCAQSTVVGSISGTADPSKYANLQKLNIRVFDGVGGPEIDPTTVDWAHTPGDRYHFRQEPGEENAMASVKINFPSPFGVYMHDTPTKQLFEPATGISAPAACGWIKSMCW